MEEALISKKDLLEVTGVSYGQLYRWKRKKLIPEEWFIRKSTFTGQETFFPKEKILDRIEKIKNMKEDVSLDELAELFSPQLKEVMLNAQELIERNIVSKNTLAIHEKLYGEMSTFLFDRILYLFMVEKALQSGQVTLEEGKVILETLEEQYHQLEGQSAEILLFRKFGMSICAVVSIPNQIYLENEAKMVLRLNISECLEDLKLKV